MATISLTGHAYAETSTSGQLTVTPPSWVKLRWIRTRRKLALIPAVLTAALAWVFRTILVEAVKAIVAWLPEVAWLPDGWQ